jgi:HAD superfamily hydrolase (TIGR01509 family)
MFSNAKGFLFDLNGTMVNDMPYHIAAWHKEISKLGGKLTLEEVKYQCYGKNDELLERVFPRRFSMEEKIKLGTDKEALYRIEFKPHLKLIDGLEAFLANAAKHHIKMGIGSAAITDNINFVIDNMEIRHYFDAIVSANDVVKSKPDPETFLKCAQQLDLAPADCIVFEDTPKGVECAQNAGMKTVVILGAHEQVEFAKFDNVIHFTNNYTKLAQAF